MKEERVGGTGRQSCYCGFVEKEGAMLCSLPYLTLAADRASPPRCRVTKVLRLGRCSTAQVSGRTPYSVY